MKTPDTGHAILRELEALGYQLRVEGDQIRFKPAAMAPELMKRVREHKPVVLRLLALRSSRKPPGARFESLRAMLPTFWEVYETRDGRKGILWGVTARGVLLDIGGFIYAVEPDEVGALGPG